jgi:uncharacterized membrane protein
LGTYIILIGLVGLLLGAWIGGTDLALSWGIMGGILGYALALGSRVRELQRRVADLTSHERKRPGATESARAEEPSLAARKEALAIDWPPQAGRSPAPVPASTGAPAPAPPEVISQISERIRQWASRGNPVVQVGTLVLFFGVAFLVKYAADHDLVPIELRLAGVALGGLALLATGWRLRLRSGIYATVLQGAGVGVIYLTVYAAARLYGLIPPLLSLILMLALVVTTGALAVLQDAFALALFGTTGGFLAPVLASTGEGSHVVLFSYYALLNAGILGIAWFRTWRVLNLAGFVFTFVLGGLWGYRYYRPELFATTEPFLILFFLLYVAIAVLFARRQEPKRLGYVDGTLVFGVPLVAFGLQSALVSDLAYGQAWSALALGAFYLGSAGFLWRRDRGHLDLLTESFLALGIAFASLAVPLALSGQWTGTTWALEGAALVWIGVRQGGRLPRAFGVLLQLGGGAALLLAGAGPRGLPVLNGSFLSEIAVAAAGLFSAGYLQSRSRDLLRWETGAPTPLMVWGIAWWLGAGLTEIDRYLAGRTEVDASLAFLAVTAFAAGSIGARVHWRALALAAAALLPALVLTALGELVSSRFPHPFGGWGGLAWPLALLIHFWLLRRMETTWPDWVVRAWHPVGLWLVLLLVGWELDWMIGEVGLGTATWQNIAWVLGPGLVLALLWRHGNRIPWPVRRHFDAYAVTGLMPLALGLYLWAVAASTLTGAPAPLPYLPLLNPMDLAQLSALLAIGRWCTWLDRKGDRPPWWPRRALWLAPVGVGGFLWLNTVLARAVHFWGGTGYHLEALYQSMVFQAAAAVLWSLTALPLMVIANRRGVREPWVAGALLLAAVVLKLFLVDLSGIGTLARIVSFLAVGGLMLLIGYLAPIPPRAAHETGSRRGP